MTKAFIYRAQIIDKTGVAHQIKCNFSPIQIRSRRRIVFLLCLVLILTIWQRAAALGEARAI